MRSVWPSFGTVVAASRIDFNSRMNFPYNGPSHQSSIMGSSSIFAVTYEFACRASDYVAGLLVES